MKVKDQIINISLKNPKEEICGFVVQKDNEEKVIQCKNKAPDKDKLFLIGAKDFLNIKPQCRVFGQHLEPGQKKQESIRIMQSSFA